MKYYADCVFIKGIVENNFQECCLMLHVCVKHVGRHLQEAAICESTEFRSMCLKCGNSFANYLDLEKHLVE